MARFESTDDQVSCINSYAVFMGYLSRGVRGLSVLVLTWNTVVLLGGFVSVLGMKDFWCLTVITLVQTAGVFRVFVNESFINSIMHAFFGSVITTAIIVRKFGAKRLFWVVVAIGALLISGAVVEAMRRTALVKILRSKTAIGIASAVVFAIAIVAILLVQQVAFAIVLLAVAALYTCGMFVSAALSLWRLVIHDYGVADSDDASRANLKPSLLVLYSMALIQGLLVMYITLLPLVVKKIVKTQWFGDLAISPSVLNSYLEETITGCQKDPSFARGRNLITYSLELLESSSPHTDRYSSGVRLLDALVVQRLNLDPSTVGSNREDLLREHVLMKQLLLGSSSSSHLIRKLLQTLDSRSPYDREVRGCAARIVAYIASDVRLGQFPGGIRCVASLLDAFEEYSSMEPYQRDWADWLVDAFDDDPDRLRDKYIQLWPSARGSENADADADGLRKGYEDLVLQGMRILRRLADDDDNCRIIGGTPGLLSRIMAPLTSDPLHTSLHDGWLCLLARGSLKVMRRLVAAPGDTGMSVRRAISADKEAIMACMERILGCDECRAAKQREVAAEILKAIDGR